MFRDNYRLPRKVEGDKIGVEIEVEGDGLKYEVEGWDSHDDGSLRGEAVEYVLPTPLTLPTVKKRLNTLSEALEGCEVKDTGRAGVHIHINIQDMEEQHVFNFIILYLIFEEVLIRYCGEDRIGNLFCLRMRDAEYLSELLQEAAQLKDFGALYTDDVRYASINCKALVQYGSLEFRGMRSTIDSDVLVPWIEMLLALKEKAKCYHQASEITIDLSRFSPEGLAKDIFTKHFDKLDYPDLTKDVMKCMRDCQMLAHEDFTQKVPVKKEVKFERPKFDIANVAPDIPQPLAQLSRLARAKIETANDRERPILIGHFERLGYHIPEELR